MTPARATRVAELLRAELAAIVRTQMRDPRVSMLSITDVRVGRDLGQANIYVSSLAVADADAKTDLIAVLNGAAGFLRSAIARQHNLRMTPRLRFHYDDLIERGPRLDALIDEAMRSDRSSAEGEARQNAESATRERHDAGGGMAVAAWR